jgi:hypothetical protein
MTEVLKLLVVALLSSFGTLGAVLFLLYLTPEKAQKWGAILLKLLLKTGVGARLLHKKYIEYDIQGRVNEFVKIQCADLPGLAVQKVRLEWVDGTISKRAILEGNLVVVRVRRDDPKDMNFVHAVCLFVSKALLFKAKHYIAAAQGEAADLFVSMRLLEREKPAAIAYFSDEYLRPVIDNKKGAMARVFDDLNMIDKGKLFWPVYLQELDFLGNKVFGGRKDAVIAQEVSDLLEFLKKIAGRHVGQEDVDLTFCGAYCKFGIVIVGKRLKLWQEAIKPYINYIRRTLIPAGVETIYLLAPEKNAPYVRKIEDSVKGEFERHLEGKFRKTLLFDNKVEETDQYLLILRARGRQVYLPKGS